MTGPIPVLDASSRMRPDAYPRLIATMLYPSCPASIEQAVGLILAERSRYPTLGDSVFMPSELVQTLLNRANGKFTKVVLAGLLGQSVGLEMSIKGSATQYSAVRAGLILAKKFRPKLGIQNFKDGRVIEETRLVPASETQLEGAFRTYQDVLPICMAFVSALDQSQYDKLFNRSIEFELSFLRTVLHCQNIVSDFYESNLLKPWWVHPSTMNALNGVPTLLRSADLNWVKAALGEIYPESLNNHE